MNSNEISNYSTQEQPFCGTAWLVLNILLKRVLLLSSVSVYVACENRIVGDNSLQPVHVCLQRVIQSFQRLQLQRGRDVSCVTCYTAGLRDKGDQYYDLHN